MSKFDSKELVLIKRLERTVDRVLQRQTQLELKVDLFLRVQDEMELRMATMQKQMTWRAETDGN